MALYFNSDTLGQLVVPQYNYKWFIDGYMNVTSSTQAVCLLRSDVPGGNSFIVPYDVIGRAAIGTYVPIFTGVQAFGGPLDYGILKTSDDTYAVTQIATGEIPTAGSDHHFFSPSSVGGAVDKQRLYFGYMCYDDNPADLAELFFFFDTNMKQYEFAWTGADVIPPRPVYTGEVIGEGYVDCTVTDNQIGFGLPNIWPTAQTFYCSRANVLSVLVYSATDLRTANGGGDAQVPVDFEGSYSSAEYGSGTFYFYSDSRGAAAPASDQLMSCGLINIYNPSAASIYSLAEYLHSDSFFDTISKVWDNPMESIISLALFPIAPAQTSPSTIILGGVDTNVSAPKLINSHAVMVSFGTIDFKKYGEYYGGFLDYSPYTIAQIFLPYIGQHSLRIEDIQNASITLYYTIDFLNGDITAQLDVKDGVLRTLETLHGNCAVSIPLTSSNYAATYSSLIATAGAIVAGQPLAAASSALLTPKAQHNSIGGISSSAGMHGRLDAFILLNRPNQVLPKYYGKVNGRPLKVGGTVKQFSGYTQGEIIPNIPNASDYELEMIIQAFREGVYL